MKPLRFSPFLPVLFSAALVPCAIHASILTWDGGSLTDNLWSSDANWVTDPVTGPVTGDSLIFSGSTRLTPSNDLGTLSISTITFNNTAGTAGAFTLGGNDLTLTTEVGAITNNSTALQTINNNLTYANWRNVNTASGDITLGGVLNGSGGNLVKIGSGTLTLSGSGILGTGQFFIDNGKVLINGGSTYSCTNLLEMGRIIGAKTVLSISAGSGLSTVGAAKVGDNASSSGAVYNRGVLTFGSNSVTLGNSLGAYGYFLNDNSGAATSTITTEVQAGGNGGNGMLEIKSGTFTSTNYTILNRSIGTGAQDGLMLINGGTYVAANNGNSSFNWSSTSTGQAAVVEVTGAGSLYSGGAATQIQLNRVANANNTGILNIRNDGTVAVQSVYGNATATNVVNFDNGILKATATGTLLQTTLDKVLVHSGGATLDAATGITATIAASLSAPTGNGLSGIALSTAGSGYIGRPIVNITGGGGIGATAIANWNEATGQIDSITVTSQGSGYTSAPTVSLVGGGAATAATLGTISTAAVTAGGGLTKTGAGIVVLSATNTYTGATLISGGTLKLDATGTINHTSEVSLGTVGTFDVSAKGVGGYTVGTLKGSGNVIGALTVSTLLSPGTTAGNITLENGLTLTGLFSWNLKTLSTSNGGTDFDILSITAGNVNITGATLGLNLGANAPSDIPFWQKDQTWFGILNNSGVGTLTGAFAAINNSSWSSLGTFTTTYTGNDVNLKWTAVPELNGSLLVGGLGVLGLLRRRRPSLGGSLS